MCYESFEEEKNKNEGQDGADYYQGNPLRRHSCRGGIDGY